MSHSELWRGTLESLRKNKTADRCTGTEGSTDCNSITVKHKQNIHTNIKSDNTTQQLFAYLNKIGGGGQIRTVITNNKADLYSLSIQIVHG